MHSLVGVTPNSSPLTPSDCCQVGALPKIPPSLDTDESCCQGLSIASNELAKLPAAYLHRVAKLVTTLIRYAKSGKQLPEVLLHVD